MQHTPTPPPHPPPPHPPPTHPTHPPPPFSLLIYICCFTLLFVPVFNYREMSNLLTVLQDSHKISVPTIARDFVFPFSPLPSFSVPPSIVGSNWTIFFPFKLFHCVVLCSPQVRDSSQKNLFVALLLLLPPKDGPPAVFFRLDHPVILLVVVLKKITPSPGTSKFPSKWAFLDRDRSFVFRLSPIPPPEFAAGEFCIHGPLVPTLSCFVPAQIFFM